MAARRLSIADYVRRYGAPPKDHPRRREYEQTRAFKERSANARKGHARKQGAKLAKRIIAKKAPVSERTRELAERWAEAFSEARQVGGKDRWAFFRELDKKRERMVGKAQWRRVMRSIAEDVGDMFDFPAAYLLEES